MIGMWRTRNAEVLPRDLLRDFCVVHGILQEQAQRFAHSQTISYAVLRELLGEAVSKGVFWRLKDTTHHLFRKSREGKRSFEGYGMHEDFSIPQGEEHSAKVLESLVDWCIGYAFHESCKLREDAFQLQHYSNRLLQLEKRACEYTNVIEALTPFTAQTKQSIEREMQRILGVLEQARTLLLTFYASQGQNGHVARFMASEQHLVQQCFGQSYAVLMQALYGGDNAQMYVLAAKACVDGGHRQEAKVFVAQAQELGANTGLVQEVLELLERSKPQSAAVL